MISRLSSSRKVLTAFGTVVCFRRLCAAASCAVAGENHQTRGTPPGRVLLPAARRAEVIASGSSERVAGGKQETPGVETALPDSLDRSDSSSRVAGHPAGPASGCYGGFHQPNGELGLILHFGSLSEDRQTAIFLGGYTTPTQDAAVVWVKRCSRWNGRVA